MLPALLLAALSHDVRVLDAAVGPGGDLFLARRDGAIVVVDPETGEDRAPFARHPASVERLAMDPRGELLAASSKDGRVALWPVRSDATERLFGRPEVVVRPTPETWGERVQVAWTPSGGHLLTWSFDSLHGDSPTTVKAWSRAGELARTGFHAGEVAVSPTEDLVAAVREGELLLWRPGGEPRSIEVEGLLDTVAFSPDGASLALGGDRSSARGTEAVVHLLDLATGALRFSVAPAVPDAFIHPSTTARVSR